MEEAAIQIRCRREEALIHRYVKHPGSLGQRIFGYSHNLLGSSGPNAGHAKEENSCPARHSGFTKPADILPVSGQLTVENSPASTKSVLGKFLDVWI
jgi:hypothetical protein